MITNILKTTQNEFLEPTLYFFKKIYVQNFPIYVKIIDICLSYKNYFIPQRF